MVEDVRQRTILHRNFATTCSQALNNLLFSMKKNRPFSLVLLACLAIIQTACNQSAQTETADNTETAGDSLAYRPQYHFSAPQGWINDPNGLIYANGEYHLFYQHNPFANVWGHMSWGHAVSKDLLHWEDLPVAIPEFTNADSISKTAIFSGSAILDKGNKSGLCPNGTADCMVAIYTGNVTKGETQTAQYQNMAYSADKGRTWTQYAKNPIVDIGSKEFRDPSVFWYEPQQKWVMATVKAKEHRVALYDSKDLKTWQLISNFGPVGDTSKVWECPSLLTVPIENEPNKRKWVLFISSGHPQEGYVGMQYFVGDFDGTKFTLDNENPKPLSPMVGLKYAGSVVDWGKDYYAAIPFNNLPDTQKNPLMIGWINNWAYANKVPTHPFRGAMSLPRQITLRRTDAGLELVQQPIADVTTLRGTKTEQQNLKLTNESRTLEKSLANVYELEVDIKPGMAQTVGIRLAKNGDEETSIRYTNGKLELDRTKSGQVNFSDKFSSVETAPLQPQNGIIKLRIFVDKSIVTIFANNGERVITDFIFPNLSAGAIELFSEGGTAEFPTIRVWPMKSTRPEEQQKLSTNL